MTPNEPWRERIRFILGPTALDRDVDVIESIVNEAPAVPGDVHDRVAFLLVSITGSASLGAGRNVTALLCAYFFYGDALWALPPDVPTTLQQLVRDAREGARTDVIAARLRRLMSQVPPPEEA